jgi:hypothetical protein
VEYQWQQEQPKAQAQSVETPLPDQRGIAQPMKEGFGLAQFAWNWPANRHLAHLVCSQRNSLVKLTFEIHPIRLEKDW